MYSPFRNNDEYDPEDTSQPKYGFLNAPKPSADTTAQNDAMTARANRSLSDYANDANQNVKEQSSLMGPQDPSNPQADALSARASQMYHSQVNSMAKQAEMGAASRQTQVQSGNIDHMAANYANAQQRAQMQYQQISFQRQTAIEQEQYQRQLYGQLFSGAGAVAGLGVAGMSAANKKGSTEGTGGAGSPTGSGTYFGGNFAASHGNGGGWHL